MLWLFDIFLHSFRSFTSGWFKNLHMQISSWAFIICKQDHQSENKSEVRDVSSSMLHLGMLTISKKFHRYSCPLSQLEIATLVDKQADRQTNGQTHACAYVWIKHRKNMPFEGIFNEHIFRINEAKDFTCNPLTFYRRRWLKWRKEKTLFCMFIWSFIMQDEMSLQIVYFLVGLSYSEEISLRRKFLQLWYS